MVGRLGVIMLSVAALAGCLTTPEEADNGPAMAPAPLPVDSFGDTFAYDNGRVEKVEGISEKTGLVRWRRI